MSHIKLYISGFQSSQVPRADGANKEKKMQINFSVSLKFTTFAKKAQIVKKQNDFSRLGICPGISCVQSIIDICLQV